MTVFRSLFVAAAAAAAAAASVVVVFEAGLPMQLFTKCVNTSFDRGSIRVKTQIFALSFDTKTLLVINSKKVLALEDHRFTEGS
jgi:hypothetical protein